MIRKIKWLVFDLTRIIKEARKMRGFESIASNMDMFYKNAIIQEKVQIIINKKSRTKYEKFKQTTKRRNY